MAVAGSAAIAAFAPSAGATSGSYDSVASASVGAVSIAGNAETLASATATTGNSPQSDNIGSGKLLSALAAVPNIGSALESAAQAANWGNTDLVTESATATADGHSTACAAILSADCTTKPMSLVLKLGLKDLLAALHGAAPLPGGHSALTDPLSAFQVVVTLNGPRASCAVGPEGSGDTYATDNPAGGTLDLQDNGKSLLPNGPVAISGGDLFAQLSNAMTGSTDPLAPVLGKVVSTLGAKAPLSVTFDPNSRKYTSASKATATAGGLSISTAGAAGTMNLLDVAAASATCGPNTETASSPAPAPASSSPAPAAPGTSTATSGETPLSGIQSDEGRSVPSGNSYLALNGMP